MEIKSLILITGVVVAVSYLFKARNPLTILIVLVQSIAILLSVLVDKTIGYLTFGLAILLTTFYPFLKYKTSYEIKKWIWIFIVPILFSFLFSILNLPGAGAIRFSMIISIIVFIYALINHKKFKYELGFMFVFLAEANMNLARLFY
ncbi:MAG: hypothetical protein LAT68_15175 [Cyclobacteriaceae bacterium]|nr:hypothetical protein [Cyclobacteriaceae bacterium]